MRSQCQPRVFEPKSKPLGPHLQPGLKKEGWEEKEID